MTESNSTQSNRRNFLAASAAGIVGATALGGSSMGGRVAAATHPASWVPPTRGQGSVVVVSSGNGAETTKLAYKMITEGNDVLDACIAGVNIVELDPDDMSVGYGGLPNEMGVVQLDAAVMHGPTHQAGAVACIEGVKTPSKVAKLVLEQTDHVLLVGHGATEFAKAHGFPMEELLTDKARKVWLRWKQTMSDKDDWLAPEKRDQSSWTPEEREFEMLASKFIASPPTGTIHCAGIDSNTDISCCTTTSGLAFKIPGRVGDSPIIGAGLYCDNEIGSCGSTGRGEANLQNQCSFAGVELMRSGMTPEEAGLEVLRRVAKHSVPRLRDENGNPDFGLNFYLIRKDGMYAGVAMQPGQKFAVTDEKGTRLEDCKSLL